MSLCRVWLYMWCPHVRKPLLWFHLWLQANDSPWWRRKWFLRGYCVTSRCKPVRIVSSCGPWESWSFDRRAASGSNCKEEPSRTSCMWTDLSCSRSTYCMSWKTGVITTPLNETPHTRHGYSSVMCYCKYIAWNGSGEHSNENVSCLAFDLWIDEWENNIHLWNVWNIRDINSLWEAWQKFNLGQAFTKDNVPKL